METKFKNFKHYNKFKYPYKNYKYQVNKSKDNVKETVKDTALVKVSDKLTDPSKTESDNLTWQEDFQKLKTNLISMIELKTKYYIDQRMGILINGNSLYTRGYCSLNILDDFNHGGKSLVYKNNGNPVVTMTQDGYIYCKNIFLNGLNVYEMFQNIFNDFTEGGDIYVKHIDLKNGLYDMDINSSIMKYLKVQPDVNNYLEVFKDNNNAMVMETNRTVGYSMFKPDMSNGNTIYGLRFGKDSNTGANIRYTYSTTAANQYMAMGPIGKADTFNVYYDRRVIINTTYSVSQCLLCKYNGNLSNNQYLRIGCGDNNDTGIFAYGRNSNTNYLYLKLQGKSAEVDVYANYTIFHKQDHIDINCTKTSGEIMYMRMNNVAVDSKASLCIGKADDINQEISIGYQHSITNPYGHLGFYGNENLIKWDKDGNTLIAGLLTTGGSILSNGSITGNNIYGSNIYASSNLTVDGTALITKLDVANTIKNDWYAKLRVEDYLSNGDYIRMIFKDLGGQANIDLFHDSQYYGLKLQVPTANINDNKLCIYPTGVTIDGQVDMYNDANVWGNLEVAKDLTIDSPYKLRTDYMEPVDSSEIVCLGNMEVTNEDNDAVLAADNIVVYDKLQIDAVDINSIATSADVNDDTKINDNTLATTEYIKNANVNTVIHQEIPNNPYESIAITDNPYLTWSIVNIGNYNTNTDALCYSEELHQFVIVGNNGYSYFSYDGVTWMSNSMNSFTWTGVTYGPTYGYIACTSSNMYLIKSTDGRTWVPYNNVSPSTGCAITYGNGYYAIVPDGTYASYLAYTTNPTVSTGWGSFWLGSTGKWYNIAYSKSQHKFLVVGASGKYVLFDDEFTSGSRVTGQLTNNGSAITADCHGVCFSDKLNLWIIACNSHGYCYVSQDGNTFYQHSLPSSENWHRVIWGNDRFVMTCNLGYKAAYSLDGTTWYPFQVSQSSSYNSWLGLTYGNGLFVLSGNNNTAPLNAIVSTYALPNSYITPRAMMLSIYPIGSVYISMININPGLIFGGSWTEIQNRFLYCVPTTSASNDTGGSASHTHTTGDFKLETKHLPSHNHSFQGGFSWNWGDNGATESYRNAGNMSSGGPNGWNCLTTRRWGGVNNTGGNTAHNHGNTGSSSNLPPYVTVYAWLRYA